MSSIPYGSIFRTLWSNEFIEKAREARELYRKANQRICIQAKEFKFYFVFIAHRVDADDESGGTFICSFHQEAFLFEFSEDIEPKPLGDAFVDFVLTLRRIVQTRGSVESLKGYLQAMRTLAEEEKQKQAKLNGVVKTSGGLIWGRDENGKYRVL